MSFLKHFSIFVLIIICFSSFVSREGGGGGVRRGLPGRMYSKKVCPAQASSVSLILMDIFFLFQVKVVYKQNIHC